MRIVVDTNVLVSGLLTEAGPTGQVVDLISKGDVSLCHDERVFFEYEEVLARPSFPFSSEAVDKLLATVVAYGEPVVPVPLTERLPDPTDEPFLEVALAARADCLITGNLRHYPKSKRAGMTVLSPAEFVEYLDRSLR